MGNFDFDSIIDRHGTGAIKVDGLTEFFGRDDLQGMWIADMYRLCSQLFYRKK